MKQARSGRTVKRKRRTQEERRNTSYRQLIEAAVACIAELGLPNATMSVIAKRAKLTTGAVQHHFGMRDPLLLAIGDEFGRKLAEKLAQPLPKDTSVQHRLAVLLEETWEVLTEPHFVAATEILLASRSDRKLHRIMLAKTNKIAAAMDQRWIRVFSDVGLSKERIRTIRRLGQSALRGLALRLNFLEKRADLSMERALLCELLVHALQHPE